MTDLGMLYNTKQMGDTHIQATPLCDPLHGNLILHNIERKCF